MEISEGQLERASDDTVTSPPQPAPITRRERIFLLLLVTVSTVAAIPFYRIAMSEFSSHRLALVRPSRPPRMYVLVPIFTAAIR